MNNGVDFLFAGGVEFIPGNVFRIVAIQFSPKRDYIPRGKQVDFEPPDEPGQRQSMVLKRC